VNPLAGDSNPAAFKEELPEFGPTISGQSERSPLFTRLRFAAELLVDAGSYPKVPFIAFRQKDRSVRTVPVGASLAVGRHPSSDLAIADDDNLSARHLRIVASDYLFFLEDRGSMNGTFVNDSDEKVLRRELRDGDVIFAGHQIFLFVNPTASAPLELPFVTA
jgi:hypothetical protein